MSESIWPKADNRGMYVPAHFQATDDEVRDLLRNLGAAELITATAEGLMATMLPLVYDEGESRPGLGPWGALLGHVARNNGQWRVPAIGEAMVIVRGPDAYISPAWYATKREHGRVVPTWNYTTAHVHGRLVIHDDPAWVEANVRRLTAKYEADRAEPWSVDDAPRPYVEGQLKAIVGIEVLIDRVEGKSKLSQNRSDADIAGAIEGLEERGEHRVSAAMRALGRTPPD
jgi:transcriptional regulator